MAVNPNDPTNHYCCLCNLCQAAGLIQAVLLSNDCCSVKLKICVVM